MTYQEQISNLIASVEKKKRSRPHYLKPDTVKELEKSFHEYRLRTSPLPAHAVPRTTFEDRTSTGLIKCVIAFIKLCGGSAYRVNSQGTYDARLKKWRHSGMRKGLPDVQAVVNGKYVGIEVKVGRDRQSEYQKKIQSEIEASGGIYYLAKDFTDFTIWFNNTFKAQ